MNPTPPPVALPSPKERRRLREALALSEEQVAGALGVTQATIRAWETGRASPKGRERQEAYARLLGVYVEPAAPGAERPAWLASEATADAPGTRARPAANRSADRRAEPAPAGPATPKAAKAPEALQPPDAPEERLKSKPVPEPEPDPEPEAPETAPIPPVPAAPPAPPGLTPQEAFDALYACVMPGLLHQTYLLTGRRRLARESVAWAFRHAWQHWPEVARDRDPAGWVRAAAHDYALSPWHRFQSRHRRADAPPADPARRELLAALQALPTPYRRTLLLYDGLGLGLPETAAETEASTPAAGNRLLHARTAIGRRIPGLADPEDLRHQLSALVTDVPEAAAAAEGSEEAKEAEEAKAAARSVRTSTERGVRRTTRVVIGVTASLIAVTAFTAVTAPDRYIPVIAPGEAVEGVPVLGGPQQLGPQDLQLRDKLRKAPNPGPERLVPQAE
ncbi:sigma factor-like helix-turn-helix DNA-binding protein [Streptomyces laurentii]|uniref:sigma factor-like helix-turn-helix DNA-binding protein n=1 Tax=Streptomyces laurentii TaxID=39478 RepID=UPI0036A1C723